MNFETKSQTYYDCDDISNTSLENQDIDDEMSKDKLEIFKRTIQLDFSNSISHLAARVEILEKKVNGSTQHDLSNTNVIQGNKDVNLGLLKKTEDSYVLNMKKKETVSFKNVPSLQTSSDLLDNEENQKILDTVKKSKKNQGRRSSHRDSTQNDLSDQRESVDANIEGPKLLPPDVFSFLASSKVLSKPFFMMLLVAAVQFLIFSSLVTNSTDAGKNNDPPNRLNVPVNVNNNLLVLQFLAIAITCFGQNDVRQSLEVLYYGYNKKSMLNFFPNNVFAKWAASVLIRLSVGLFSIIVTFILIVTESNARNLLLNFTAMEFVSYLDDITFLLSKWGYFGKTLKLEAVVVSEGRYDIQATKNKEKNKSVRSFARTSFLFFLFITMITVWFIIVRYQRSGSFLCPEIHVQFGDEISPELGTFSGYYVLDKPKKFFPTGRVEYRESEMSNTNAKFSYCTKDEVWVFYHDDSSIDAHREAPGQCMWNARSDVIGESTSPSYDILSSGSWFTKNDVDAIVTMPQFTMDCHKCDANPDFCGYPVRGKCNKGTNRCECKDNFYGRRCELRKPCTLIAINGNHDFVGNHRWSREFSIFKIDNKYFQVKDRPVYINEGIDYTEVIFFSGKRWALMNLEVSVTHNLASFFNSYDSNWTKYSISFLTEEVNFDSPKDFSSPLDLEWYTTQMMITNYTLNSRNIQAPDFRMKSDALLLCKVCDNISNPCLNQGECIRGTCICKHGATGDLCQIHAKSDGVCNTYFNNLEYSFDGGDCCQESCKPIGDDNMCGSNSHNLLQNYSVTQYIGYPNCLDTSYICKENRVCWKMVGGVNNFLNNLIEEQIESTGGRRSEINALKFEQQLSISPSGNVIAVATPEAFGILDYVPFLVYEEFGNSWRKRNLITTHYDGSYFSWSKKILLNMFFSTEVGVDIFSLWIEDKNSSYSLLTYEWKPQSQMYAMINEDYFNYDSPSSMASMSDNGKMLAVAFQEQVLMYNYLYNEWIQVGQTISMKTNTTTLIQAISLSYDGKIVAIGSSGNANVYQYNISIMDWNLVGDENIRVGNYSGKAISLSNNGKMVAIDICSSNTPSCKCSVFKFDLILKKWNEIGNNITLGETSSNNTLILSLSHNGHKLAVVHNGDDSYLRMYKFNSILNDWDQYGSDIIKDDKSQARIETLGLSGDFKRVAIGQPLLNTVKVFYDANVSVKKTVPITIQVQLGSGTSNVGVLLVCDSNIYLNVQLDHLVFSNQNLTKTVYINEREQCQLTVANKLTAISHRLFRIYNGVDVTKGENIIDQSSGGKFYYYSRETITFSSSPFFKAISKAPITLVLVPIQSPIDEEQKFICTLLCGNNFSIEFIANTKNSSFINTLFLETGAHCKINVVYESLYGKIDYTKKFNVSQAATHSIDISSRM